MKASDSHIVNAVGKKAKKSGTNEAGSWEQLGEKMGTTQEQRKTEEEEECKYPRDSQGSQKLTTPHKNLMSSEIREKFNMSRAIGCIRGPFQRDEQLSCIL